LEVENHPSRMSTTAILSPNAHKYSETFIHLPIQRLPGTIWHLYGGYMPTHACLRGSAEARLILAEPVSRSFLGLRKSPPPPPTEAQRTAALAAFFRKEGIQAVLAHYGPSGCAALAACRATNTRLVVHFHGYDAYRSDMLDAYRPAYPPLFQQADALVVVSQDMHRQLVALGAPVEKVHLIPYGVDLPEGAGTGFRETGHVLSVGRFVEKKYPTHVLEAFARAHGQAPGLRLTMLGDGPLLADCQDLARVLGIDGAVDFRGAVAPAAVAEAMRMATLLLLASGRAADGDSEGLPNVILEAMAAGLPVLATRHAGIPDALTDGVEGLLLGPGDVGGMAEAVLRLLGDAALRARLSAAAEVRYRADFTAARYLADLQNLLYLA
jgi:colanic acid/amylovoran biosynthesis glycosyltransferase